MPKLIRVLLADDTLIARVGWRGILEGLDDIEVVGEVQVAQEVVRKIQEFHADIVLLDLKWHSDPKAGEDAIRDIRAHRLKVGIIAITGYPELIRDAREAGADAALSKEFGREELCSVIRELALRSRDPLWPRDDLHTDNALTSRETEVLKLLEKGFTDREIASELRVAESTAKNHVQNLISKLNAKNRTHAVAMARLRGLLV